MVQIALLIGGFNMLAEGIFILTVSLSGNYDDLEFVGYFNDCSVAIQYSNIPPNHKQPSQFDFDTIRESQSCGFVGVETRNIFLKEE